VPRTRRSHNMQRETTLDDPAGARSHEEA
jgi:hypothetical protein